MGNPEGGEVLNEAVTFIQNAIPGFAAGIYRLEVSQTLTEALPAHAGLAEGVTGQAAPPKPIDEGELNTRYDFAVTGDRFAFAQPDTAVFSVFPADNSSGNYETVLPHAVLAQATLPWMRSPTTQSPQPDAQGDIPTWLWVMLLDDGDVAAHAGQIALDPATGVIGDLFPASVYANSTLPPDGLSYFSSGGDAGDLEPSQTMSTPIQFIDLPRALFDALAPAVDDLRLMAHVRKVSLIRKPTIAQVSDKGVPTGSFSIAFGNRLPQPGMNTGCYLVSLEGMAPYLPKPEGSGEASATGPVRLAVLRSWRFRSTGSPASFVDGLQALNSGTETAAGKKRTVLQLPNRSKDPLLKGALEMGYVPLDTMMRTGEKSVSWYRGPLAPYRVETPPPRLPLSSADAALIFDPTSGAFDMSYATAWTLGRMLALQDQSFSVPLYIWKRDLHDAVMTGVAGRILTGMLNDLGLAPHLEARGEAAAFDDILHRLIHNLGRGIAP